MLKHSLLHYCASVLRLFSHSLEHCTAPARCTTHTLPNAPLPSAHKQETMSETAKDKGAVSTKEKGGAEKRGRGRPRKNPQVWRRTRRVPVWRE
ncbi:hypothetical protein PHYPO_G00067370 [Pangasianodon hypophthalmus]|uniref:Uncharacterized protein n=1 Tax=Pangasianodon hypophthalmus TaxID=310915 RepID=A0A5N5LTR4_PANHP|nr:hypothetical protein PHYPO_G00067370 [Pangasianodon hypophthalmus]